jgi:hypothetical protein
MVAGPASRRSGRARLAAVLAVVAAALLAPAAALAADPPTVLSAGINAADELYATWSLAPGTTFSHADFATVPTPDPALPDFFADGNFAGFVCAAPPDSCSGTPTTTSYTAAFPTVRDRRYYFKVTSTDGTQQLTSDVQVIDDAKPQIPGDAPTGSGPTAGAPAPVGSKPLAALPASSTGSVRPTVSIAPLALPKRLGAVLITGARLRVTCSGACVATGSLRYLGVALARKTVTLSRAGTRTIVVRPTGKVRNRLKGRSHATLRLGGTVKPIGGKGSHVTRIFKVLR